MLIFYIYTNLHEHGVDLKQSVLWFDLISLLDIEHPKLCEFLFLCLEYKLLVTTI